MEATMDRLTTSEAAIAAGVSIPQIHRMIDEKILPEDFYTTALARTFRTDACLLIAFYFQTADLLTAGARLKTIRDAMAHCTTWSQWEDCTVVDHSVTIHFSELWKAVDGRLRRLAQARQMVVEDPEILSGTPVIKGTRVPLYDVAAAVDLGTPIERILKTYPSLKQEQVELASLYAKAVPQRGRPKRASLRGAHSTVVKKRIRASL